MSPYSRSFIPCAALLFATVGHLGCHEEGTIRVSSFSIKGVRSVDESRLRAVLATRTGSWLPWADKPFFDRDAFQVDLKRIEAFYVDRGFPDARITSFDVKLNDKQDEVDLAVIVSEGEPIRVREVKYVGFEAIPDRHLNTLRERAPLRPGMPLDRQLVQATRQAAANELRDHGYPYADVHVADERQGNPKEAWLTFTAVPGILAYFGPIEIAGNASVSDQVIRRQLTFRPGDLFRRGQMQESQRKLYGLELFDFANIEVLNAEEKASEVPTRVTVAEGKHRRTTFSVGYGSEEQARVDADWRHVNFFGGARTAGVHAKWSSLDRGAKVTFLQPYFLRPTYSLTLDGQSWNTDEPAFDLNTFGGRITIAREASKQFRASLSYTNQFESSLVDPAFLEDLSVRDELIALGLDPRTGEQEGTLSAITLDLRRTTTNNLLNPSLGYVAALQLERAGSWIRGSYDYSALSAEGRYYLTILGRLVLANRLRIGSIDGASEDAVPFFKRYFLGGSTSIRGWGRFEVSPLSGAGLPIGGHSVLEATSEVRFPVFRKLGGVLFVDAGNVWSDPWQFEVGDLRYAVGPGLRYTTPIGPVRFDVGYQLTPIEGLLVDGKPEKRRWRIHFSIGQAF